MAWRLTPQRIKLSENDVEAACLPMLRLRGWRVERLHAGLYRSMDCRRVITMHPQGTPDYVCVHADHPPFYLETKRTKAELRKAQELKKQEIERSRIPVIKVDSIDVLAEFLRQHEERRKV